MAWTCGQQEDEAYLRCLWRKRKATVDVGGLSAVVALSPARYSDDCMRCSSIMYNSTTGIRSGDPEGIQQRQATVTVEPVPGRGGAGLPPWRSFADELEDPMRRRLTAAVEA
ncbi:hypothetical protein M406DRAFT_330721 [Cryphonectria parasitica EP155]|uniref:Uncharacterized protein n=1 Tax=Cryphonectria parasitica (strain ATCC 38755 / EP155) TaxID=660469 RepID=A0A9P5CNQ9_CRYP1|nr:uncharacterized protein M406DRAFT_330721 [Cryphonectria parasitica EP155]KAF3764376.1 hypothetical protein M406DRAFT_330721 [Cryphonectria parasitica EP155]